MQAHAVKTMQTRSFLLIWMCAGLLTSCSLSYITKNTLKPLLITDRVRSDSDDPAIWVNRKDPSESLIIGTDKGGDTGEGGLYVFNLHGKIDSTKTVMLKRPNNVDVAYDFNFIGEKKDIAVCTERNTNSIRVFSLPDMKAIDGGGIPVFEDSDMRSPMGIALYTDEKGSIFAIVGRKSGPMEGYLYQYKLISDESGRVSAILLRKFGKFSGRKEIEAIAVDNELGYVYYSDEGVGVRKYYAHPDSNDVELALFATNGVRQDHEGISIYKANDGTGYILLSDQQANAFHVYPREGTDKGPHDHPLIKKIHVATKESDGSEVSSYSFPPLFPNGLFVAMSTDGTFQLYRWEDLAGKELFLAPNGIKK